MDKFFDKCLFFQVAPQSSGPRTLRRLSLKKLISSVGGLCAPGKNFIKAVEYFADKASDKAGLTTPQRRLKRIGSRAVEAVPSAVLAPEATVIGTLSAAASGAASQTVAENGGSPLQQTLAGLTVGNVPLVSAGAQAHVRWFATKQITAGRIADAASSGTLLPAGQATGSKLLQSVET